MPCVSLPSGKQGVPDGVICGFHPVYEFDGYLFEVHRYHGPTPLRRKDHEPRLNIPAGFWDMWKVFDALPDAAKRACLFKED